MLEATGLHHNPLNCFTKCFSSLTAVHVANAFDSAQHFGDDGFVPTEVDQQYLKEIGLEDRLDLWRQASSALLTKRIPRIPRSPKHQHRPR